MEDGSTLASTVPYLFPVSDVGLPSYKLLLWGETVKTAHTSVSFLTVE